MKNIFCLVSAGFGFHLLVLIKLIQFFYLKLIVITVLSFNYFMSVDKVFLWPVNLDKVKNS